MSNEHTAHLLTALVQRYLASNLLDSARFYSERLYYEHRTEDSLYLLGLTYFRAGKAKQTYLALQGCLVSPACKYLFALACEKLDKLEEGEHALQTSGRRTLNGITMDAVKDTPGGAEGVYLLGRLCRRQHRKEAAIAYFKLSLRMDPYLWSAVTELSEMGVVVNMAELLSPTFPHGSTNNASKPEGESDWMGEVRASSRQQHFSVRSVFRDAPPLDQHKAVEHLAENATATAAAGVHVASPRVSMALGLSSMSLHVPFASPSSLLAMETSALNSAGLASVALHSTAPGTADRASVMGESGARSSNLHGTRTALFGLGTPGLTPMGSAQPHTMSTGGMEGAMRGALFHTGESDTSGIRGVDLFGSSAPNSSAVPGAAGQSRRVSFGPTARLSFSGAFDGAVGAVAQGHHLSVMESFEGDETQLNATGGSAADNYPYKLPRADPQVGSPSAATHRSSEATNRVLPHKMMLSPFPVESSPIAQTQHIEQSQTAAVAGGPGPAAGVVGDTFPSPAAAARKKYSGKGTPGTAEPQELVRRDGHSAGIAGVDDTFIGQQTASSTRSGEALTLDASGLNHLVVTFSRAYQMLCTYCCRACIQELQSQLPEQHLRSALASQWIGRAFYEMNEYKSAVLAFREMLRLEPFRLCGLETLSTALWHLKRDKELCALAQQVVEVDKLSPEAWCVVGNCFSLQREPDTAIKFFQRALQVDPSFVYAHTLCGHEQVNNEDLDKAVECFRLAILHNPRHYNAWYGLGSVFYRQEKYELAEYHFRSALELNPASSVLHCYLGMALHAQDSEEKTAEALQVLTSAAQKDSDNPQLHFQRATILLAVDDLPAALEALLIVEEHAPREPPVHALLGQVYHRMGELQMAIKHLNIAMDLDPKEASTLKGILEHIDDPPVE